jgi:hypothetical protein
LIPSLDMANMENGTWSSHYDEASGSYFWFDSASQTSHWEMPATSEPSQRRVVDVDATVAAVFGFVDPVVSAIIQRDLDKNETAGSMILHLTKFASEECARECVEAILSGEGVLEGAADSDSASHSDDDGDSDKCARARGRRKRAYGCILIPLPHTPAATASPAQRETTCILRRSTDAWACIDLQALHTHARTLSAVCICNR